MSSKNSLQDDESASHHSDISFNAYKMSSSPQLIRQQPSREVKQKRSCRTTMYSSTPIDQESSLVKSANRRRREILAENSYQKFKAYEKEISRLTRELQVAQTTLRETQKTSSTELIALANVLREKEALIRNLQTRLQTSKEKDNNKSMQDPDELNQINMTTIDTLKERLDNSEHRIKLLTQENEKLQSQLQHTENLHTQNFNHMIEELANKDKIIENLTAKLSNQEASQVISPQSLSEIRREINEAITINYREIDQESAKQLIRGHNRLLDDFLRYGRKQWNDKLVLQFLKMNHNMHKDFFSVWTTTGERIIPSFPDDTRELVQSILASYEIIKEQAISQIKKQSHYSNGVKKELEHIRTQKQKFHQFMNEWSEASKVFQDHSESIVALCDKYINQVKEKLLPMPSDFIYTIKSTILDVLGNIKTSNSTTPLVNRETEPLPSNNTSEPEKYDKIKILIRPTPDQNISEIENTLGEEILKSNPLIKITNAKRTTKKNILFFTESANVEPLQNLLQTSDKLQSKAEIILPDARRTQLLVLNIPKYLSDNDLRVALEQSVYRAISDIKLLKAIPAKSSTAQHWIIETNLKMRKQLLDSGYISILFKKHRVVSYIKSTRCTTCQTFGHVKHNCKSKKIYCAKCANEHRTQDCQEEEDRCINCKRANLIFTNHNALSPMCPIYKEFKEDRLQMYYQNTSPTSSFKPSYVRPFSQPMNYQDPSYRHQSRSCYHEISKFDNDFPSLPQREPDNGNYSPHRYEEERRTVRFTSPHTIRRRNTVDQHSTDLEEESFGRQCRTQHTIQSNLQRKNYPNNRIYINSDRSRHSNREASPPYNS